MTCGAKLAMGLATLATLPGCGAKASDAADGEGDKNMDVDGIDPRLADYEMPLESEPHERTLMQWPVNLDVYDPKGLAAVQAAIAKVANTISDFEPVAMMVTGAPAAQARKMLSEKVELWDIPTDDLWCRDSGPTFVRNSKGELAVAEIQFNGWGNKQPHSNDAKIAAAVADRLGLPYLKTGLVGEQGGVEHDGAGTLLAHASCWVNPNRSKETGDQIATRLMAALGGKKMIWAPGIKGADITDYHIDALARFTGPGQVLIQIAEEVDEDDPWSVSAHETLSILRKSTGADGKPLSITVLDEPMNIRSRRKDFVSSYVNYYVCNGAVISAEFGDAEADEKARATLTKLYPGREIVALNVDAIGDNGGGIHCATQQVPKARA